VRAGEGGLGWSGQRRMEWGRDVGRGGDQVWQGQVGRGRGGLVWAGKGSRGGWIWAGEGCREGAGMSRFGENSRGREDPARLVGRDGGGWARVVAGGWADSGRAVGWGRRGGDSGCRRGTGMGRGGLVGSEGAGPGGMSRLARNSLASWVLDYASPWPGCPELLP
jgi:hypothetical protein